MTGAEEYLKEIIRLQIKKPKKWNWELSTSKSSPHICLPEIQLYNSKGKLLVQTKDNGSTNRQSWHRPQYKETSHGNPTHLQRCKSDILENRTAQSCPSKASSVQPTIEIEAKPNRTPAHIQGRRSNTIAISLAPSGSRNRSSDSVSSWGSQNRERHINKLKVKSKSLLFGKHSTEPYKRGNSSAELFEKTRQKYNIKESLKRAENDGYKSFIYSEKDCSKSNQKKSDERKKTNNDNDGKRKKPVGCLAAAETISCYNKPTTFEVNNVVKPKRYRLRKSRAGTLVISDDSCSSSHRRRCHGDFGDCRDDNNDIFIDGDNINNLDDLYIFNKKQRTKSLSKNYECKAQRSRSEKDKANVSRASDDVSSRSLHFRQSSDPAGVKTAKFLPNRYGRPQHSNDVCNNVERTESTRKIHSFKKVPRQDHCLFQSKSDVFPFQKLFNQQTDRSCNDYDKEMSLDVDDNCNYIVQEPLTTPGSDSEKCLINSISVRDKLNGKTRTNSRHRHSNGLNMCTEKEDKVKGPVIRTSKPRKSGDCDLLHLVRRLSLSQVDNDPKDDPGYQNSSFKSHKSIPKKEVVFHNLEKNAGDEESKRHVNNVMGANVSRHSTKGLSGRRSQSSGSICNGKGRHQGDGSGKGSGGSLPSYLDDQEASCNNNYHEEDEKASLDEVERIPPLGDGAPLHWKFSDTQTALCQDQGYGSERSPEEEYPPPLPDRDLEQCHHHLEAHSCYPFITSESTFSVKLSKGSRGLGLSVTGGVDSAGSWPGLVRIKRLFPHQPASACGLLNVGDLLLEANGVPLTGLTNYEALEVLRTAANQVELKVCRPPPDVLNCVSPISEVPPPPPTRREPPNSLNLSSTYYASTAEDEYYHGEFEVILTKIQGSLGFTLRKEDDSALGHYVRALVREPALTDGRVRAGDKIIAVNDVEISPMSHEQAVQYLRQCGDIVKLRLYRDSAQTPVAALSPTETTPRTSFSRKANLRQEAVDMLNDIAVRKLIPGNQDCTARGSLSPNASPRRLRRHNYPSDASQESCTKYLIPEEQFHEGMLKCSHFDEEAFNSLFTIESDDMDRPSRPSSLDLYNPNQTPVAARKPRFNFSLAHNAYELNNLDPEVLDAPNLTYNLGNDEANTTDAECGDVFPKEPASMPHIPLDNSSMVFSNKNPAYQSAHPTCVESDARSSSSASKSSQNTQKEEETDTIKRKKGILKKDSEKRVEKDEIKTENQKMTPMKEDYELIAIELNRGWNSRLGFSLQGAAGVTYVSAVHADSVAAKDGRIKPGDRVIKVNDESVEHLSTAEIIDLLRIVRGAVCIVVKRIKSNEDCLKSNAEN